ncbi:MAG: UDP-N-acetylglucosamine 1-carboxyvinyltransferase, partial [Clostridia bacterium]|nr:UDP-N-acetylglucosamine 1-carboxyvinyltransferase [Clostridia bacterium]
MEGFCVHGGEKLQGEIPVPTAKNAVLPIMAAAILARDPVTLHACPDISDVRAMGEIIEKLGCRCDGGPEEIRIHNQGLSNWEMPDALSRQIRSSIFLLGPILAKLRRATVSYPGGCEIGLRPIDLHLKGLRALGVRVIDEGGRLYCDGREMHAGDVYFDYPSVGATENVMMAAALLPGVTVIHNATREPEIEDLQRFINALGGRVWGAGTQVIQVEGVPQLHGGEYTPIPDRIAAGTFLCAGAMTGGSVTLRRACLYDLLPVTEKLKEMGCRVWGEADRIALQAPARLRAFSQLQTQPHPGFPTDMQSPIMAAACVAEGTSVVIENVFENRFGQAADLRRMGADIRISGRMAV